MQLLAKGPQTGQREGHNQVLVSGMPLEGCGYPGLCCKKGCWAEAETREQHWAPGSQSKRSTQEQWKGTILCFLCAPLHPSPRDGENVLVKNSALRKVLLKDVKCQLRG